MSDACYCDAERPSVVRTTTPTARKLHRCRECGGDIHPGERYESVWGVWEGRPEAYKICPDCVALVDYITAHAPCYCRLFGGLHEDARETLEWIVGLANTPGMGMECGRLLVACRRRRAARRNRIYGQPSPTTTAQREQ